MRLSFGLVNGRPLFLDLEEDSYFLLEPGEESSLLEKLSRNNRSEPRPVERSGPAREAHGKAEKAPSPSLGDIIRIYNALRQVRRALKAHPLAAVIDEVAGRIVRPGIVGPSAEELALRFRVVRRLLPHPVNCLADSLALLILLKEHGRSAELVFGAKLDPFAAHCWLECDGTLLNDHLDRIEGFAPVGVVQT